MTAMDQSLPQERKKEPVFDAAQIFADVRASVVSVKSIPADGKPVPINGGGGTGFFVSSGEPNSCEVATVTHFIESEPVAVVMQDGQIYTAKAEKIDLPHEIAVYKVMGVNDPAKLCKPVELDNAPPALGEKLLGVGADDDPTHPKPYEATSEGPLRRDQAEIVLRLDLGDLEGEDMNRDVAGLNVAGVSPGISGGPLFAVNRKVKGLYAAGDQQGFAEFASFLQKDLDDIRAEREGKSDRHP